MKKIMIFFAGVLLIGGIGCKKDYLDINTNPNLATNANPPLVLPAPIQNTAARQISAYTFISGWMGYWAISGSYAIGNNDFTTYQQTTDFGNGLWSSIYDNLEDYDYVETQGAIQGDLFFEAAAKIMKAYDYEQLVDMFGNVPYSEALKGTKSIQPKYDNAQDIYDSLEANLAAAITLMRSAPSATQTGDIMFGGDNTNWIKFANILRLRLLLRQSQIGRDAYIQSQLALIKADTLGFLDVDAAVDPGYTNSEGKQNPFYGFAYNTTGTYTQDYWRANQYSILFYTKNNDPRFKQVIGPALTNETLYQGNYIGQQTGAIVGSLSATFGPGVLKSYDQPAVILSAAESYFLQAEAALRGWIPGDPKAFYQAGVTASFEYLGVADAANAAMAYYSQPGNKNTNFDAATTTAEKLGVIIRQKWAAMNNVTPFEAWADYRRLHLPADIPLSLSPYVDVPAIPLRIIYPTVEYQTNAKNVPQQASGAQHTEKIFWIP